MEKRGVREKEKEREREEKGGKKKSSQVSQRTLPKFHNWMTDE